MNKYIQLIITSALLITFTGCASTYVYKGSQKQVAMKKARAMGNEAAVRAIELGDNGVGVGIDVGMLETIRERPVEQTIAAFIDVLCVYGTKELVDDINNNSGSPSGVNLNIHNSSNISIIINRDGTKEEIPAYSGTDSGTDGSTDGGAVDCSLCP